MTATPDIERRVSHHHDDIAALYDLQMKTNKTVRSTSKAVKKIAETQQEHGMRLTRLEEAAEATNEKLEATNQKLEATNEKLDATNQKLEATNQKVEATNQKVEATNQEVEATNEKLDANTETLDGKLDTILGLLRNGQQTDGL